MSSRLQVVLDEAELREIQQVARRHRMTTAEWVRQALRAARRTEPRGEARKKLDVVRAAARDALHAAVMGREKIARVMSFDAGFDGVPGLTRLG